MPVGNFEHPDMYWFRRIDRHPRSDLNCMGEDFCRLVASWLEMQAPKIFWFEAADASSAKEAFRSPSSWGKGSYSDPLREPCEYFRWNGSQGTVFHGYTHSDVPLGIMINSRCEGGDLLFAIAEECFHFYQDKHYGPGWLRKNMGDAEGEAKKFLKDKATEIHRFLEQWRRSGVA